MENILEQQQGGEIGWNIPRPHLGGFQAAGGDKAGPEDALVARDAVGAVLLRVQKCAETVAHRLSRHHLVPLPTDLRGKS